jgi:hypothetical protein
MPIHQPRTPASPAAWRVLAASLLALACAVPPAARGNGDGFFNYAEIAGKPEFVYFGSVRDVRGQRLGKATVRVLVPVHQLEFTATTDALGRYRTPDVGRAIKELGYPVNPNLVALIVEYPGYHEERRESRARRGQASGVVEMNFLLAKDSP